MATPQERDETLRDPQEQVEGEEERHRAVVEREATVLHQLQQLAQRLRQRIQADAPSLTHRPRRQTARSPQRPQMRLPAVVDGAANGSAHGRPQYRVQDRSQWMHAVRTRQNIVTSLRQTNGTDGSDDHELLGRPVLLGVLVMLRRMRSLPGVDSMNPARIEFTTATIWIPAAMNSIRAQRRQLASDTIRESETEYPQETTRRLNGARLHRRRWN